MKLINLTPHQITLVIDDGEGDFIDHAVEPSGSIARVSMTEVEAGKLQDEWGNDFIPIIRRVPAEVEGLPEPTPDTIFIVSSMVLDALKHTTRTDVFAPDTGPSARRNDKGQVTGVYRLVCL